MSDRVVAMLGGIIGGGMVAAVFLLLYFRIRGSRDRGH